MLDWTPGQLPDLPLSASVGLPAGSPAAVRELQGCRSVPGEQTSLRVFFRASGLLLYSSTGSGPLLCRPPASDELSRHAAQPAYWPLVRLRHGQLAAGLQQSQELSLSWFQALPLSLGPALDPIES